MTVEIKITHDMANIILKKTGHENHQLGATWQAKKYGVQIHSNGRIPFKIPATHHKRVIKDYYAALSNRKMGVFLNNIGAEFGKNNGIAASRTVKKYLDKLLEQQGGDS